jgi:hypothetical protein
VVSSGVALVERLVGDDVADAARAAAREDCDDDDGDDADVAMEAGMSSLTAADSDEEEASALVLLHSFTALPANQDI